jgi:lysozyme family protein
MSDFKSAITDILEVKKLEGVYSNDPNDPGGETKYGISEKSYPHLDIKNLTIEDAENIYLNDWWNKYNYGAINDQSVAEKLLSFSINMGSVGAHICIQRSIRAATGNDVILSADGIFGPKTISAVNSSDAKMLLAALRSEAACHYRMRKNPFDEQGLENRAYD